MLDHVFKVCEREGNIDSIYLYVLDLMLLLCFDLVIVLI